MPDLVSSESESDTSDSSNDWSCECSGGSGNVEGTGRYEAVHLDSAKWRCANKCRGASHTL